MEERKKTQVADMDRGVYDIKNDFEYSYISDAGLTEDIIREIWSNKNEPEWMLDFRLKSLEIYNRMGIPNWIPDITGLDMANIHTYVKPKVDMKENWDEVPEEIKSTFDRLGIPEAEKHLLQVLVLNMTLKLYTTVSKKILLNKALSILISKLHFMSMKKS